MLRRGKASALLNSPNSCDGIRKDPFSILLPSRSDSDCKWRKYLSERVKMVNIVWVYLEVNDVRHRRPAEGCRCHAGL
jgi:hypothetical protein